MLRVLVTGGLGQLGRAVAAAATARGLTVTAMGAEELDITDPDAVLQTVRRLRPQWVINCAAYTDVDRAEAEPDAARAVNASGVEHLATACSEANALLVQISTDYVFPGTLRRPYREDDPTSPLGVYGRTKLEGERAARGCPHHLIVRTAWLYGHGGRNFVEAIRRQLARGVPELRVVDDQRGNPTYATDLAEAILDLAAAGARGTVHAAGEGTATWLEFAREIATLLGATVPLRAISTAEAGRPAPRPADSTLDTSQLQALIGRRLPPWRDGLRRYLAEGV